MKVSLGVGDTKIGGAIADTIGYQCVSNEIVTELFRGIRFHFVKFINGLKDADLVQSQLGLGHSYSRSKVKFNVHRVDNMIIQSISLLDQLDKDLNTFSMRVREWYSWHFPELVKIVNDNFLFCRLTIFIQDRTNLSPEKLPGLVEILQDNAKAQEILDASRMSMGTDISPIDLVNIEQFAHRVVNLAIFRRELHDYLLKKMSACAPNLAALVGEQVGARLISHAGSLVSLAKYPASTLQILGAEKALFRSLKTKGNTPKYGLIFHSSFIGRASTKNKGRMARYLANKCSIASRIDSFAESSGDLYGQKLRQQVEERLEFYKTGKTPRKNLEVMQEAVAEDVKVKEEVKQQEERQVRKQQKKEKKRKAAEDAETLVAKEEQAVQKKKKNKKAKKAHQEAQEVQ